MPAPGRPGTKSTGPVGWIPFAGAGVADPGGGSEAPLVTGRAEAGVATGISRVEGWPVRWGASGGCWSGDVLTGPPRAPPGPGSGAWSGRRR